MSITITTPENVHEVSEGIFNLEAPLLNLRSLAYAIRSMASSGDMPKMQAGAIGALADTMMMELDCMIDERETLWNLSVQLTR